MMITIAHRYGKHIYLEKRISGEIQQHLRHSRNPEKKARGSIHISPLPPPCRKDAGRLLIDTLNVNPDKILFRRHYDIKMNCINRSNALNTLDGENNIDNKGKN